jgi:hypothetical protein
MEHDQVRFALIILVVCIVCFAWAAVKDKKDDT